MTARAGRSRRIASVVAVCVLTGLLILATRRLDIHRTAAELARARPVWIGAALIAYLLILPLWAEQWRLLAGVPTSTRWRMLGVVAMTSSVLNTTPLLLGEMAGVHFLATVLGIGHAAGVAVLAMDQLFVGLAKVAVFAGAASTPYLPAALRNGGRVLAGGVVAFAAALAAFVGYARHHGGGQALRNPRVASAIARMATTLTALRSPRRAAGALLLALAKKGCELLAILALQRAFGVTLPAGSALVVLAALNLATLLPVVPGNLGVYEAAVTFAYGALGVPLERAVGMAVVQHACYFVALALPGYAWLSRAAPPRNAAAIS